MPAAVRSSAAAIILLGATLGVVVSGCGRRPPKVETVLAYEIDPEALPGDRTVNMLDVLAACRRRLISSSTPLGEVRQCGARGIEIGVYGKDPALVHRVQALMAMRGTLELRILANRRDHLPIIERALAEQGDCVRDDKRKPLARWAPVWPGRETNFTAREGIVTRNRRVDAKEQHEVRWSMICTTLRAGS